MNAIEKMEQRIRAEVPKAHIELRRPRNPEGEWWLDVELDDHDVTIQWSFRRGFGVTASAMGDVYGEGPEETFTSEEAAYSRVVDLLRAREHTIPPKEVLLRELRNRLGFTQAALATSLGVQQAAISRLERREDISLSSLRRYVAALGADLEINIRTPQGDVLRLAEPSSWERRFSCSHLEPSDPAVPTAESREELESWVECTKHRIADWFEPARAMSVTNDEAVSLASSDPSTGHVRINLNRIWGCARTFAGRHPGLAAEMKSAVLVRQFLTQTLAHEIGHCAGREWALPSLSEELRADAFAGWVASRLEDNALVGATISSSFGCEAARCSHPTPAERASAYLLGYHHRDRDSSMLKFLVIRTTQLERSREFYEGLGLKMREERHGTGPLHYSCEVGRTVVELYPSTEASNKHRLGLELPFAAEALDGLWARGLLHKRPSPVTRPDGVCVCVVRDPDGNAVELELKTAQNAATHQ